MRDNNDMAHTAQFDRAQEIDTDEPCARPVAGVRTPEETAAALRARLATNHANTLAYVACLKACTGNQRPYREVEEELLSSPAFDISMLLVKPAAPISLSTTFCIPRSKARRF